MKTFLFYLPTIKPSRIVGWNSTQIREKNSWDEERGREGKLRRQVKKKGMDEKSMRKGHIYLKLVYDLE